MTSPILELVRLGPPPWPTLDPFLFCVHHLDHYPAGNDELGPDASLAGRNIGMDFEGIDGWRMYHGDVIPGFPRHPHRGFETVTLARRGFIDHSDSLGATARFGQGDAQWMTAGQGIVHCEMFPLLNSEVPNTAELFQIWLNLPAEDKLAEPHFAMFWSQKIPRVAHVDDAGKRTEVVTVAGSLAGEKPPSPPPSSWASRPEAEVAIWTIRMEAGAKWTLPAAGKGLNRALYFFDGEKLTVAGQELLVGVRAQVKSDASLELVCGDEACEILLLQGRPIDEAVAHYGPFVMNTNEELRQAMRDYQRTEFGGWPWSSDGPVHERGAGRFAIHAGGERERPEDAADQ